MKISEKEIARYFDRLWPIFRSITGDGVRQSLDILGELVPTERIEIPSGTQVFDWVVPPEWAVREAYVIGPDGQRVIDISNCNLHLLNYSSPFQGNVSKQELNKHLHSKPDQPDAIPYVTSYYEENWGFSVSDRQRMSLPEGTYEVQIDTEHFDGSMTLGEAVLSGEEEDEVLISCNVCHPSMANNELSGPLVAAFLYKRLAQFKRRRLTYRFVFLPETIGSLAYLHLRGEHLKKHLVAGYALTCVGLGKNVIYKKSARGDSLADRVAEFALEREIALPTRVLDFYPRGSDERQYCSPGFMLPVGTLMRTIPGDYPEYHTSLDDRDLISFETIRETVDVCEGLIRILEANETWRSLKPHGEPQLRKYGLYPDLGGTTKDDKIIAIKWVLSFADGIHDLLAIAERSGLSVAALAEAAESCGQAALLEKIAPSRNG